MTNIAKKSLLLGVTLMVLPVSVAYGQPRRSLLDVKVLPDTLYGVCPPCPKTLTVLLAFRNNSLSDPITVDWSSVYYTHDPDCVADYTPQSGNVGPIDPMSNVYVPITLSFIENCANETTIDFTGEIQSNPSDWDTDRLTIECCEPCPNLILAGDQDNFAAYTDPPDKTSRRPTFYTWFQGLIASSTMVDPREFDELDELNAVNAMFGYTFEGLPQLESCQLEVHIKADNSDIPSTDGIMLRYVGNGNFPEENWWLEFTWQRWFNKSLFSSWDRGSEGTLVLDLSALPRGTETDDLIPLINADGYLDVLISDDTAVDYIKLCYVPVLPPPPIPTVSEWGLVVLALLLLAGGKVYFSRRRAARMTA